MKKMKQEHICSPFPSSATSISLQPSQLHVFSFFNDDSLGPVSAVHSRGTLSSLCGKSLAMSLSPDACDLFLPQAPAIVMLPTMGSSPEPG